MTDKKKTPPDNTGKKYDLTITDKQIKFIDLYCSKYGELSATDCAIRAGYSRTSAYQRAHELLNPRLSPANLNVEQNQTDTRERIKRMYDREDYEEYLKAQINDIYGPEPTPEEREARRIAKEKKMKEDEAAMRELEEYQEMRTKERNRKLGLKDRKF